MFIYKIVNNKNSKVYIGLTALSLQKRWIAHICAWKRKDYISKLYRAFTKYGIENFKIEEIDSAETIQELSDKEIYWIKTLNSVKNGYNILHGGIDFDSDSATDCWKNLGVGRAKKRRLAISNSAQGRSRINKKSKFIGVRASKGEWTFSITHQGIRRYRNFKRAKEAAIFYDKIALYLYGPKAKTNFSERYTIEELKKSFDFLQTIKVRQDKYPHKYKRVVFSKQKKRWLGCWFINGKKIFSKTGRTEEEAFKAQQIELKKRGFI